MVNVGLIIDFERLAITEPLLGVVSATYRMAIDYIPSTQLFGWLLRAITLSHASRSSRLRDSLARSTLKIIDLISYNCRAIKHVEPGIPTVNNECYDIVMEFKDNLNDLGVNAVSRALSEATVRASPYILGVVNLPKFLPFYDRLKSEGVTYVPLAILPLINYLRPVLKSNKNLSKRFSRLSKLLGIKKRFGVGIAADRLRKCAAYGKFYSYQYLYNPTSFVTAVSVTSNINELVQVLAELPLGFKKSISLTKILRVSSAQMVSLPYDELVKLSLVALKDIAEGINEGEKMLAAYAYGDVISSLITNTLDGVARINRMWINCKLNDVYLSLTNSFYRFKMLDNGRSLPVAIARRGSYAEYLVSAENLDELERRIKSLSISEVLVNTKIIKVKSHEGHPDPTILNKDVGKIERELVIKKSLSSMHSLIFIPYRGEYKWL